MTNPIIKIHNTETDEIIEREMNDAEYTEYLKSFEAKPLSVEEAKAEADKAALLAKLGITADEAKLLLS
jgi:hypothetical protein